MIPISGTSATDADLRWPPGSTPTDTAADVLAPQPREPLDDWLRRIVSSGQAPRPPTKGCADGGPGPVLGCPTTLDEAVALLKQALAVLGERERSLVKRVQIEDLEVRRHLLAQNRGPALAALKLKKAYECEVSRIAGWRIVVAAQVRQLWHCVNCRSAAITKYARSYGVPWASIVRGAP